MSTTQTMPADAQKIDPALSIVLDLLRFGAALAVMFGHLAAGWLTGGYLWQLGGFLHVAVMVFFVLSGYVIAATTSPRHSAADYAAARIARLYSVVLPALAMTALLDAIGLQAAPHFYDVTASAASPSFNVRDDAVLRYLLTLPLIQEFWPFDGIRGWPGSNGPMWSLSYEAAYYVFFGIQFFLRGHRRILAMLGWFVLVGPQIAALLPIWLLGVLVWRLRTKTPAWLGWPMMVAGVLGLAMIVHFDAPLRALDLQLVWSDAMAQDVRTSSGLATRYAAGLATALLVLGVSVRSVRWRPPAGRAAMRAVADHTFELYALHLPVAVFAAAVAPFAVGDWPRAAWVYGLVAVATFAVARLSAPLKAWLKLLTLKGLAKCSPS